MRNRVSSPTEKKDGRKGAETVPSVDPLLLDLLRLRASQIDGHAVVLTKHRLDVKADDERAIHLKEWHTSRLFSKKERAALALCEAIVLHPTEHLARGLLREARTCFSKEQIMLLTLSIIALIDWNPLSASCLLEDEKCGRRVAFHRIE